MRYVHNIFTQAISYSAANFCSRKNRFSLRSKNIKRSIINEALSQSSHLGPLQEIFVKKFLDLTLVGLYLFFDDERSLIFFLATNCCCLPSPPLALSFSFRVKIQVQLSLQPELKLSVDFVPLLPLPLSQFVPKIVLDLFLSFVSVVVVPLLPLFLFKL